MLDTLALPLTSLFVRLGQELSAAVSDGSRCVLVESLRLCCRVFFSLNWQDLPEFFEDHIAEWMGEFERYLCYENFSLGGDDDDDDEGPVERLQAAIVENASLYAQKFATLAPNAATLEQPGG